MPLTGQDGATVACGPYPLAAKVATNLPSMLDPPMRRLTALALIAATLSGCAKLPDMGSDPTIPPPTKHWPKLGSITGIIATGKELRKTPVPGTSPTAPGADTAARAAELRQRAAALSAQVLPATAGTSGNTTGSGASQ